MFKVDNITAAVFRGLVSIRVSLLEDKSNDRIFYRTLKHWVTTLKLMTYSKTVFQNFAFGGAYIDFYISIDFL